MWSKLTTFIHKNKTEFIFLVLIVILALFFRLYRISEYLTFLGDEGRDVRVVRNLIQGDLVFIGPQTSIGGMYLGPLYYYMMAIPLWLSGFNPVGPAIMVALLSVITIIFTWWVARKWFSPLAGIISAFLFAISPVSIIYSHSSWNPNPMPFFALLSIWMIYQVWHNHHFKSLKWVGIALAFALQMHYLGLLLIPTLGLFWFLTAVNIWNKNQQRKDFIVQTLIMFLIFFLLMSPLLLFDFKHQGMNFNAFKSFFTDRQTTINFNPANSNRFLPVLNKLVDDLILGSSRLPYLTVIGIIFAVYNFFIFFHQKTQKPQRFILLTWITFGFLGLSLYKQHVYAHYFGFLFPAFYILLGFIIARLIRSHPYTKPIGIFIFILLAYINLSNLPLLFSPNRQLQRTEQIVDLIIKESGEQPFNFSLIAKQNYDESYRYFLENKKANLVRGEEGITDQLFVVCEDGDKCQPEGNPQWQIAVFGPSHTVNTWQVDHIKIYRLLHSN